MGHGGGGGRGRDKKVNDAGFTCLRTASWSLARSGNAKIEFQRLKENVFKVCDCYVPRVCLGASSCYCYA